MFKKILLLLLMPFFLNAITLQESYEVNQREVDSSIFSLDKTFHIATIDEGRVLVRLSKKELLLLLRKNGYSDVDIEVPYVSFKLKSVIDVTPIKESIREYFLQKYGNLEIKNIKVTPRSFMQELPSEYEFGADKNTYLLANSTIHIMTPQSKKFFFDYELDATLELYISKSKLRRGSLVNEQNFIKKRVQLKELKDMPLFNITSIPFETNKPLEKDAVLTIRDVIKQRLIKRGEMVDISYENDDMDITFSAKALQDGRANDIIRVQNMNKKIIRVKVIGKNLAVVI